MVRQSMVRQSIINPIDISILVVSAEEADVHFIAGGVESDHFCGPERVAFEFGPNDCVRALTNGREIRLFFEGIVIEITIGTNLDLFALLFGHSYHVLGLGYQSGIDARVEHKAVVVYLVVVMATVIT